MTARLDRLQRLGLAFAMALTSTPVFAQPSSAVPPAKRQQVQLLPPNTTSRDHPVQLSFDGLAYPKDATFGMLRKLRSLSPDETFIVHAVDANRTGTEADILGLFAPDERDEIRELVTNPKMFAGNQTFYRRVDTSAFVAKMYYGPYIIFMIRHSGEGLSPLVKSYPLVDRDGEVFLTNRLQGDLVYVYLTTAYGEWLERTAAGAASTSGTTGPTAGSSRKGGAAP